MSGRERRPPRFAEPKSPVSDSLAGFDHRIGTLRDRGWPVNKHTYLILMLEGRSLEEEWPLSGDYLEQVPPDLPGDFPDTLEELLRTRDELSARAHVERDPDSTHGRARTARPDDDTRSPRLVRQWESRR